jgi:hypothetical protein
MLEMGELTDGGAAPALVLVPGRRAGLYVTLHGQSMHVLLLRPVPKNDRFGLGPFFRIEPLGMEYIAAALEARGVARAVKPESVREKAKRAFRSTLVEAGFSEAVTLSFIPEPHGAPYLAQDEIALRTQHAGWKTDVLRPSLLPSLLEARKVRTQLRFAMEVQIERTQIEERKIEKFRRWEVDVREEALRGGGGVRRTLRIVARYADACNVGGGFESVKRKDEVLRRHCEEVGRDESEIERTASMGVCIIRDDPAEAQRVLEEAFRHNGNAAPWEDQLVGTPEQVADKLRPYLGIGFRHFSVGCPPPFDAESMERLIREVKPMLEAA